MLDVRMVSAGGVTEHTSDELPDLLTRNDGIVWVDVPAWDESTEAVLRDVFGFHPLALRACASRTRVPKLHAYADHIFIVLHAPQQGQGGHVHFIELDRFIGSNYLVTVHGPLNPAVPAEVARSDVDAVLERVRSGRFRPTLPFELSHAVVSSMTRRMEAYIEELTAAVWGLEQRVTLHGHTSEPEAFLDELFQVRHGLLAVMTMAAQSAEIYRRLVTLSRFVPEANRDLVVDLVDQYDRLHNLAEQERDYLDGVIEFYRTRTDTRMLIAGERLAVIAVVTLPVTALASVFGMNFIEGARWSPVPMIAVITTMAVMSTCLLIWAKRKGWW